MLFTSIEFLAFVFVVFVLYYTLLKSFQWPLLLAASYVFYALADVGYLAYIISTTVITYFAGLWIDKSLSAQDELLASGLSPVTNENFTKEEIKGVKNRGKSVRNRIAIAAIIMNLGILAYVKYTNFVIFNVNSVIQHFGARPLSFLDIALPMGISFYIFKSVSYLIDIKRNKYRPQTNFFKLALYVSFFPQLVQGPISRYDYISKTLFQKHEFHEQNTYRAIERIMWGLFKKLVVADRLSIAVRTLVASPEQYDGIYVLLLMFLYTFQLYGDFTGGIDITMGISQLFGVDSEENFNVPYSATNVADFWRRWHITMGTWFKDYVFYPLSLGSFMRKLNKISRKVFGDGFGKRFPVHMVSMITWFITGLWHGSTWNFIVWGLLNGLVIVISQELEPFYKKFHSRYDVADKKSFILFQQIRTLMIVSVIRLLDIYRNVGMTFAMVLSIFSFKHLGLFTDGSLFTFGLKMGDYLILGLSLLMIIIVSKIKLKRDVREYLETLDWKLRHAIYICLFLSILLFGAYGMGYDGSQFIYNQF